MIEKVNPSHPDKVADRIAGAIVDLAYTKQKNPKIAVEVLIGHGLCTVVVESSVPYNLVVDEVYKAIERIAGSGLTIAIKWEAQDEHLAKNQNDGFKCGDNGIFKGVPMSNEEKKLSKIAREIYNLYESDGKYILDNDKLIICQSNAGEELKENWKGAIVNPLGYWTGGTNVDTGATNRKLGSDMGQSVTGGGLHGKDLSKADVSINIYTWLKAQETGKIIEFSCAIGDDTIDGKPYPEIVEIARKYIQSIGGFERFAEWGLIR